MEERCVLAIGIPPPPPMYGREFFLLEGIPQRVNAICLSLSTDMATRYSNWVFVSQGQAWIEGPIWVDVSSPPHGEAMQLVKVEITVLGLRRISSRRSQPFMVGKGELQVPIGRVMVEAALECHLDHCIKPGIKDVGVGSLRLLGSQMYGLRHAILNVLSSRLGSFLQSPSPSPKPKARHPRRLQALSNSNEHRVHCHKFMPDGQSSEPPTGEGPWPAVKVDIVLGSDSMKELNIAVSTEIANSICKNTDGSTIASCEL